MKYLIYLYFAICGQMIYAQTFDLTISIPNLKSRAGELQIGIYNNKETFPHVDEQYKVIYLDLKDFSGVFTIQDLPKGQYAVALFHDENADKICNTNFLGVPREGYGFSNNIRPFVSAPSFSDCSINLNQNISLSISLIY